MSDTTALTQYFDIIHKHSPPDALIGLTRIDTGIHTNWYSKATMCDLYRAVAVFNGDMNVFARITPVLTRPAKGRGKEADSAGTSVLWVDVDSYDRTDATLATLETMPNKPTLIVSSGKGLQVFWLLNQLETDLDAIKQRNKGLVLQINKLLGVADADHCFDLARVLRVPSTYNLKYADKPLCTILEYHPDRIYTLDQFAPAELTDNDRFTLEYNDCEALPDDFLATLGNPKLADRIESEAKAQQRGAKLNSAGDAVCRYKNDLHIACALLTAGKSDEVVAQVLTHNQWFSGDKYHTNGFYYVESTLREAKRRTEVDAMRGNLMEEYTWTDLGNAQRMYALFGENIHYVEAWGTWLVYNGKYWQKDSISQVDRLAHQTALKMAEDAIKLQDDDKRAKALKFVAGCQNNGRLVAMIAVIQTLAGVKIVHTAFDTNHWLLNTPNGTINLRTGKLQPHDRRDLITKTISVAYDENAQCPRWLAFLDRIFASNAALIEYMQRAIGYSLTGDSSEQCMHFAHGDGKNGKSTFFEVLMRLLGPFAQKAASKMLMAQRYEGIPVDVARLQGIRLAVASEIGKGNRLDEEKLKDLTGDDTLSARFMRRNPFEFTPTHKLWVYGNSKPVVRGIDEGIWRRLRLIPFNVSISPQERDPYLKEKLIATELPGILAWAVQGCLNWQSRGLTMPDVIVNATNDYRSEMDILAAFIADECTTDRNAKVTLKELYRAYVEWCKHDSGEFDMKKSEFHTRLEKRGFPIKRSTGNNWYVFGLRLCFDPKPPLSSQAAGGDAGDGANGVEDTPLESLDANV